MWKQACDAYAWSSFDPGDSWRDGHHDLRGGQLHNDLQLMQEEERDTYIAAYRKSYPPSSPALSRCANPMVTGRSGFDYYRQEKTNRSYQNRYEEFRNWRKKFLKPSDGKRKPHDRRKRNWKRHGRRSNATSRAAPTPSTGLIPDNAGAIAVPCLSAASEQGIHLGQSRGSGNRPQGRGLHFRI